MFYFIFSVLYLRNFCEAYVGSFLDIFNIFHFLECFKYSFLHFFLLLKYLFFLFYFAFLFFILVLVSDVFLKISNYFLNSLTLHLSFSNSDIYLFSLWYHLLKPFNWFWNNFDLFCVPVFLALFHCQQYKKEKQSLTSSSWFGIISKPTSVLRS